MSSLTDDLRTLDEQAFGARVEPHRHELHVHCHRLLGSVEEAEDLVQEAFLRAWRRRETHEGRASVRAWLYRIATNACLDTLAGETVELAFAAAPTAAERELLARSVECSERADPEGLAALLHADVRFTMPPTPGVWAGRSTVVQSWIDDGFGSAAFGSMRCVVTRANGRPAVAGYLRRPGDAAHEPLAIDVLRVEDGVVTESVTFDGAVFEHLALPATLRAAGGTR